MKCPLTYRDLIEGLSCESSIFTWNLMQLDNYDYEIVMTMVTSRMDKEVPQSLLEKIRELPYP